MLTKTKLLAIASTLATISFVAGAVPLNEKSPLRALYYVYSAESNDYFYSINYDDIQSAIHVHGYNDLPGLIGTIGYVEAVLSTHTAELMRFYKWLPETDHFYTTDQSEADLVRSWGWNYEGIEGHLYTYQVPGTVPLYRLNKWNPTTGDQVHYFATDASDIQSKISQGYANDGVKGYIYTNVTPNAAPAVPNGRILGRRCDLSKRFGSYGCNQGAPNSRDDYFNQGFNLPSHTWNPSQYATHYVSFDYISYDWSRETGHQDIMLRNTVVYDPNNITWGAYDGVGLIFGGSNWWCGGDDYNKVSVEVWRPNAQGNSTEAVVVCASVSNTRLQNGVMYSFAMRSTHDGNFCYSIRQGSTTIEPDRCVNVKDTYENMHNNIPPLAAKKGLKYPARFAPYPLPNFSTGANTKYTLVHANDANKDFTSYFLNINSYWWY